MKRKLAGIFLGGVAALLTACSSGGEGDTGQVVLTDLQWRESSGLSLPYSYSAGPKQQYPAPHDYEQTPAGAVLAAINGQAALATASDLNWPEVVNTVALPGPGRDEFATARVGVSIEQSAMVTKPAEFVGYRLNRYGDHDDLLVAAVDVVVSPTGADDLFAYPVALVWEADDWRMVLPTGEEAVDAELVTDTETVTYFEGDVQ